MNEILRKKFEDNLKHETLLRMSGALQEHKINLWQKKALKHRHNHHIKVFNLGMWKSPIPISSSDEEHKRRKEVIWAGKKVTRKYFAE